jgi:hypothetical protein
MSDDFHQLEQPHWLDMLNYIMEKLDNYTNRDMVTEIVEDYMEEHEFGELSCVGFFRGIDFYLKDIEFIIKKRIEILYNFNKKYNKKYNK